MTSNRSGPQSRPIPWMALLVLVGAAGAAGPATGQDPSWKAVAASGRVEASADAETSVWTSVARGDDVASRSAVRTGRRGRATLARGADILILDPGSEVVLPATGRYSTVEQTSGSVLYEVDGRVNPDFKVVTPYLVAGVKGTQFVVTVDERGASVSVRRGVVEVFDPMSGDRLPVRAGEAVLRESGGPTFERVTPGTFDAPSGEDDSREVTSNDDGSAAGEPVRSGLASRAPAWFDSWPNTDAHGQNARRGHDGGPDKGLDDPDHGRNARPETPGNGPPKDVPGHDWSGGRPGDGNGWPGDVPPEVDPPPVHLPPVGSPDHPDRPPLANPQDSGPQNLNRND